MKRKPPPVERVPSPCISVCTMNDDTGYCRGCQRTLEEITGWERYSDTQKKDVLEKLAVRRREIEENMYSQDC